MSDAEEQPAGDDEVVDGEIVDVTEVGKKLEEAGFEASEIHRITEVLAMSHRGPLPLASEFAGYESAVPGSGARILAMAEKEQNHRHEMDGAVVEASLREDKRLTTGQWMGITAVAMCCIVAVVALALGYPTVAGIVMGATIVSLAAVFVIGKLVEG